MENLVSRWHPDLDTTQRYQMTEAHISVQRLTTQSEKDREDYPRSSSLQQSDC